MRFRLLIAALLAIALIGVGYQARVWEWWDPRGPVRKWLALLHAGEIEGTLELRHHGDLTGHAREQERKRLERIYSGLRAGTHTAEISGTHEDGDIVLVMVAVRPSTAPQQMELQLFFVRRHGLRWDFARESQHRETIGRLVEWALQHSRDMR